MKSRTVIILVALAAAAITFGQWAVVNIGDDFSLFGPENYKVFTYGFPFRIIECAPELPIHTPTWQIPFRFIGNFVAFLLTGLFIAWLIGRGRERMRHRESVA